MDINRKNKCNMTTKIGVVSKVRMNSLGMKSLGLFFIFGLSACTMHSPYVKQDRGAVEVRRGEAQGWPAPTVNRPVYVPQQDNERTKPSPSGQRNISPSPPAVARLVSQAEDAIRSEDYITAAGKAESALRLDPQSVAAYYTLARTYLFEGRYGESEQMALRAMSLVRSQGPSADQGITRDLWLLIAETRRNRSDFNGAEQAMERAGGRY